MELVKGLRYNWRGLVLSLKTPKLLLLGMLRLGVVVALTILLGGLVLYYHRDLMALIWQKPASAWLIWLWVLVDWLTTLLLVVVAAVLSYLLAQVLFCVLIMDRMSQITETLITGRPARSTDMPLPAFLWFLIKQELPRAVVPLLLAMMLMIAGWLTPLGPLVALASGALAAVFLAWDNTDLVPARRMVPFADRFRFLTRALSFHLGFGLWFLVPGLNLLFLSYAPVGATIYHLEAETDAAGAVTQPPAAASAGGTRDG
jgi:CysZ protein